MLGGGAKEGGLAWQEAVRPGTRWSALLLWRLHYAGLLCFRLDRVAAAVYGLLSCFALFSTPLWLVACGSDLLPRPFPSC